MLNKKRLETRRNALIHKPSDPTDGNDPSWVKAWLANAEEKIAQKEKASEHKQQR